MKANSHPKYNPQAQVVCSCGNMFTVGSTKDVIHVELCNKCHPFYTGQQKFVDTASRIEKFQKKIQNAKPVQDKKKKDKQEYQGPLTLRDMLQAIKR
ncbi:MAG: 50S ribosomal protein L31 [Candidatus Levybacteria bacterium RIFCSPHIGHO2_01_FULL_36_15]|nr:MAG: 50S ribosomal protein L31 [Candidatus Levybacteria bacterium RIFCSPHIGHO2_01_FULL_36_15]OGH38050.1 MAG: 50S ribosomal protein L31 [Candidatus Levybacteria bacterium RIFCSPLOWO2_01_FULL_36_10]